MGKRFAALAALLLLPYARENIQINPDITRTNKADSVQMGQCYAVCPT